MLQSWSNRRTNVRLVAEVVRLVAVVVGDRKGQLSRNKVDGRVQNLKPAIPNRKRSHDQSCNWSCHLTTSGTTNRLLTDTIQCGDVYGVQATPHSTPDAIDRTIDRRGHDWSYDWSFMATTSRTVFSNRCWSRDNAYDQSYDDLPPERKTDRSHVRQIATDRTIKQSYDPVWLWLKNAC